MSLLTQRNICIDWRFTKTKLKNDSMQDYIKIPKSFSDWRYFSDANYLKVYIFLLLEAEETECKVHDVMLNRGQLAVTYRYLCSSLNLSEKQIRLILKRLKGTEIEIERTHFYSIITILEYDKFK